MKETDIVLRLFLAVIVGGLIGYEREFKNRPAGFRTHILVCVGAAVISMIQLNSIQETIKLVQTVQGLEEVLKADMGRLGAQVITGVGFLGAGTIVHEKGSVKGLTTAASIWSVACIGLAAGLGYYSLTLLSAVCVFVVLVMLKKFETRFIDKTKVVKLQLQYHSARNPAQHAVQYFRERNIKIKNIEFSMEDENENVTSLYTLIVPKEVEGESIVKELKYEDGIIDMRIL